MDVTLGRIVLGLAATLTLSNLAMAGGTPAAPATNGVAPDTVVGRYGFNWSKPDGARCVRVTAALAQQFKHCAKADTPSFTGQSDHLACRLADGEFLAFPTLARCQEELETMQANAP